MENKNYEKMAVTESIVMNGEGPLFEDSKKSNNSTFFKVENISMVNE